jgi:ribosome-associated protein
VIIGAMIKITDTISIPDKDIQIDFVQASGPGGQNVNKVASQVQLRFDTRSAALPDEVRLRLLKIARKRINAEGYLLIEAKRHRSQERNRADALSRLEEIIFKALQKPETRKTTTPSAAVRQQRLDEKKRRSEIKRQRRSTHHTDPEE